MKRLWFCLGLLLAFAACTTNAGRGSDQHDAASQAFTRTFEDFGFSITTPCELEDEAPVVEMDNYTLYSYSGAESPDNPDNATIYIVQVRTPKGSDNLEGLSESEQNQHLDQIKNLFFDDGNISVERVLFSDNQYPGYTGGGPHDGILDRTVVFNNGKYIISLSVAADPSVLDQDALDRKFSQFTSTFKVIG